MWSILENVLCVVVKNIYFVIGWNNLHMFVIFILSIVLFRSWFLIDFHSICSIHVWKWVIEASYHYCIAGFFPAFSSVNYCCIYLGALMLGLYVYNFYLFLMNWPFNLYPIFFFILCGSFGLKAYCVWVKPLAPACSLNLQWVSVDTAHSGPSCINDSAAQWFFIGVFNPFTFKVIINREVLLLFCSLFSVCFVVPLLRFFSLAVYVCVVYFLLL